MIYLLLFIALLLLGIANYYKPSKIQINLSFLFVLFFCCLKYGVGFDYFSYEYIFNAVPNYIGKFSEYKDIRGEYLFLYLFSFFKLLNINYVIANSIIVCIINLLFIRFIINYIPIKYRVLSLLILYSMFFVYIFSILRQGLAIALFLNFALPLLVNKQIWKYVVVVFIISLFHSSVLIALLFIFNFKFSEIRLNRLILLTILSIIIVFFSTPIIINLLGIIGQSHYANNIGVSPMALLARYVSFLIIAAFFVPENDNEHRLKSIYILGFFIYILLSSFDLVASRVHVYFKILEILMIPLSIARFKNVSFLYMNFIAIISFIVFITNLNGVSQQSNYKFYEYPYITIFNTQDFYEYHLFQDII